jgi:hypothetical protein
LIKEGNDGESGQVVSYQQQRNRSDWRARTYHRFEGQRARLGAVVLGQHAGVVGVGLQRLVDPDAVGEPERGPPGAGAGAVCEHAQRDVRREGGVGVAASGAEDGDDLVERGAPAPRSTSAAWIESGETARFAPPCPRARWPSTRMENTTSSRAACERSMVARVGAEEMLRSHAVV